MGSHVELLAKGGGYASLIQLHKARDEHQAPGEDDLIADTAVREFLSDEVVSVATNPELSKGKDSKLAARRPKKPSLRRLLALNKPEWKQGLLGLAGAIGFGFVQPIYAYTIGDLLGSFYSKDSARLRHDVRINCAVLASLSVFALAVNIIQHYNFAALGEHLTKRIRVRMLSNILRLEVGWHDQDENASGVVCSRLATDASTVRCHSCVLILLASCMKGLNW